MKALFGPGAPAYTERMVDLIVLLMMTAFFALAVLFVHACERIIGPDVSAVAEGDAGAEPPAERRAA